MASPAPLRVLFFGTPDVAVPTLVALAESPHFSVLAAVTQPDKPAGRDRALRASPVKLEAARRGIPVLQPERIKKSEAAFLSELAALGEIDIGVVIAFGQILPPSVLYAPRAGCVNLHASILPRWRGAAPMQRALMSGDKETGVCLMRMEEGLDSGPVFSAIRLPLTRDDDFGTLHDRVAHAAAELTVRDIPKIVSGILASAAQPAEGVTLAPKIANEEARIDWTKSAESIENLVRGLSPSPGAYTVLGGKRLKIYKARGTGAPGGPAGCVLDASSSGIAVACGSGAVLITDLQFEGRKRMLAAEFLKGAPLSKGQKLGV
jgi:methionyl-tRNA formyltransferase